MSWSSRGSSDQAIGPAASLRTFSAGTQEHRFMEALIISLLPIIFRAINMAPQIQQAIHTGTSTVSAVENNAGTLLPNSRRDR
jgi:hypothetical protein